jgi:hypothetical protein
MSSKRKRLSRHAQVTGRDAGRRRKLACSHAGREILGSKRKRLSRHAQVTGRDAARRRKLACSHAGREILGVRGTIIARSRKTRRLNSAINSSLVCAPIANTTLNKKRSNRLRLLVIQPLQVCDLNRRHQEPKLPTSSITKFWRQFSKVFWGTLQLIQPYLL